MTTSERTARAWAVYELAAKALAKAEQEQRFKYNPYGHPDKNRRLAEAVERAARAFDKAGDDLAKATAYEA